MTTKSKALTINDKYIKSFTKINIINPNMRLIIIPII